MEEFKDDTSRVLIEFSKRRNPDAEAICDLAMYNYVEVKIQIIRVIITSSLIKQRS